ncbi:MAG: OmpA/MotB family protein [Desulfobaccales bacterium]
MRRPRSAPTDAAGPSRERWLVSYADYVTLLLAFFVTIYAISRLDNSKLIQAQHSIHRALNAPLFLGGFPLEPDLGEVPASGSRGDLPGAGLMASPKTQIEEVSHLVQKSLQEKTDFRDIRLMITGRGLVIHLPEFLFFASGEAQIRPEAEALLNRLADILQKIPNQVVVEGHTDNRPINTPQFPSNWELSVHRATSLVRYLVEKHNLDPARFAAAGYGEYAPLASNDNEAGRSLNRRVDIVIKPLLQKDGLKG